MLLDEPFAGIDPIAISDIRKLVRQLTARGIGVLVTDHNVRETLELIDTALIIHEGQVLTVGHTRRDRPQPGRPALLPRRRLQPVTAGGRRAMAMNQQARTAPGSIPGHDARPCSRPSSCCRCRTSISRPFVDQELERNPLLERMSGSEVREAPASHQADIVPEVLGRSAARGAAMPVTTAKPTAGRAAPASRSSQVRAGLAHRIRTGPRSGPAAEPASTATTWSSPRPSRASRRWPSI